MATQARPGDRVHDYYLGIEPLTEKQLWSHTDFLLAHVVDALRTANWQRSGNPELEFPEPLPRPEFYPSSEDEPTDAAEFDQDTASLEEMAREAGVDLPGLT